MFKLFFLLLFVGGWALAAASLHVVRTPNNITTVSLLPKNDLTFDDTYVDTRQWTMKDVPQHRDLVRRLLTTGKSDVLAHLANAKDSRDISGQLADAIGGAPPYMASSPSQSKIEMALAQLKSGKVRPDAVAKILAGAQ